MKKTFLVTGGNGYIGSHMCKLLVEKGHRVHFIDNASTSPSQPHSYGTHHQGDIADQKLVSGLVHKIKPDGIFHFAARAIVEESERDPWTYYQDNLLKNLEFLLALQKTPQPLRLIFSSSCAVYGEVKTPSITEEHPKNPCNTYGLTKLLMEKILEDMARHKLLDTLFLRYFNVMGAAQDGTLGENHSPETHLIPNLCLASLGKGDQKGMTLYGDQHPTPDGSAIRDYLHVEDLVRAHFQGFEYLEKNPGVHAFNLGSGLGHSVKEVIAAVEKESGQKIALTIQPARPGDPSSLVANTTKAREKLNFSPQRNLQDGISSALKYFKKG